MFTPADARRYTAVEQQVQLTVKEQPAPTAAPGSHPAPAPTATPAPSASPAPSATPAAIFPLLTKLSHSHLRKLNTGLRITHEKLITELEGRNTQTLPARLSLPEQGAFHLGYYHQVQKFYTKKDKEDN